ncbi:HAF repeat-containing protein [Undibacterium sp. TS12]|uniref:HAF repeat-containing protein n=1 Tax=Undibacterium sp. TS12 TaxID=2908202 RepID=UPI001F4C61CD|nr:HAF repeat-containing protein [Undibacterium sp. TS12]MCH8619513.1 HAF repeat-containing protein [Undibacterium sp. TS12]
MHHALRSCFLLLAMAGVDAGIEARATTQSLGIISPKKGGSVAYDMNASGQVAAVIKDEKDRQHAVFFEKGKMIPLDALDETESEAKRINDKGEIVGSSSRKNGTWMAFIYSKANGMQELGTLGGPSSHGTAINNSGTAVGFADTANGEWHAFLRQPGEPLKDLGTFGGKVSYASGINNLGQVVGTATTTDGFRHAFVYDAARGMVDLGTLGGRYSSATAINDQGMIVGTSEMPDRRWHAFVHDGKRMTDLGAIIGTGNSFATDINNAGHVVGTVDIDSIDLRVSFVWRDNKMLLHPAGKGLYLTNAINNQELVIGATYDRGLNAATMHSNTAPFVDLGGTRILSFNMVMMLLAGIGVIFRKRFKGLLFDGYASRA